nr:hypothetical protein [Tanacetum cinerariifolium]
MANLPSDHNEFALAVEFAPDNVNGWIEEEEEEEYPEIEQEKEEMEIDDELDDPEVINPYEIEEGELPPPPAKSETSSNIEPEVEADAEDETKAATVGTITRVPYQVYPFSSTTYVGSGSSHQRLSKMDQYLGKLDIDLRSETWGRCELQQSVKIPPSVDDEQPLKANGDVTTLNDAQPSEPQGSPCDS